ncbi:hypothetical protein D3C87_1696590 [compost metagenome]
MSECKDTGQCTEDRQRCDQCLAPAEVVGVPACGNATHTNTQQCSAGQRTHLMEAETQVLADNRQCERQQDDLHCIKKVGDKSTDQYVPLGYSSHGFTWF